MAQDLSFGEGILKGLREAVAYERGEVTGVRKKTVTRMSPAVNIDAPPKYTAEEIVGIRLGLAQSQQVFARSLAVSPSTVRAWEQGVKRPAGATRRLLQIAASHPEVFTSKLHVEQGTKARGGFRTTRPATAR